MELFDIYIQWKHDCNHILSYEVQKGFTKNDLDMAVQQCVDVFHVKKNICKLYAIFVDFSGASSNVWSSKGVLDYKCNAIYIEM